MAILENYKTLPEQVQENMKEIATLDSGLTSMGKTINKNYDSLNERIETLKNEITNLEVLPQSTYNIINETSSSLTLKLNNLSENSSLKIDFSNIVINNDNKEKITIGTLFVSGNGYAYMTLFPILNNKGYTGQFIGANSRMYQFTCVSNDICKITYLYTL